MCESSAGKGFYHAMIAGVYLFLLISKAVVATAQSLPGTDLLTSEGNFADKNTSQIIDFLEKKISESEQHRAKYWNRQFADRKTYEQSVEKNRERFRHIIGARDKRQYFDEPELAGTLDVPSMIAETKTHKVYTVRWPVFELLNGEGLLVKPKNGKATETVILIPPPGVTPEQYIGLENRSEWLPPVSFEANCMYVVPVVIDREKRSLLTNREYVYRPAYQTGRHVIGYEVQEILSVVDWLKKDGQAHITVAGVGDGGLIAMYAAAIDSRIDKTIVYGYFNNRDRVCDEPIDRNIFGLLEQFGDAEIASLIAPRTLVVFDDYYTPEQTFGSFMIGTGAPGKIVKPDSECVNREVKRAGKLVEPLNIPDWITIVSEKDRPAKKTLVSFQSVSEKRLKPAERMHRIINGMSRHTQALLNRSELTRQQFWQSLNDINNADSPEFAAKLEWYRKYFAENAIGVFDDTVVDPKARTRKKEETDKYTMYEVEMDVFDNLTVYGYLLIPKGMKEGEKRPVVVCQHGLEGTPAATLRGGADAYSGFTTEICERGYITFAPQGIFTGLNLFRQHERRLAPLGKTKMSIMLSQHRQLVNWLGSLPFVEKEKIAFYGLSYGGYTAMRIPPLIPGYCLSICSANFNTWNIATASTLYPFSYMMRGEPEYDIYEFDLANTFDYSDMARLIAPRPFMVERGYRDGVGWDEFIAFEYAKVFDYYAYRIKKPERTEIHLFDGLHKINGEKTYPFLDKWLKNF